jgi:uncharacterized membrane protein
MENNNAWLQAELAQWVREGLISDEQARRLYARYPIMQDSTRRRSQPWGKLIFSALGVLVFGLGIILLFAYNWDAMHRYAKLAVIGLSLVIAHSAGFYLQTRKKQARLADCFHLLGTMLFGAGIWLVSQIYHISGHYPDAFMLWAGGAVIMAWVLPSAAQGMLAAVLIVLWSGLEIFEFQAFHQLGTWGLVLTILPLAWLQRSLPLFGLSLLLLPLSYCFTVSALNDVLVLLSLWWIAGAYLALSRLSSASPFPESSKPLRKIALLILLPLLFMSSFMDIADASLVAVFSNAYQTAYYTLPLLAFIASWSVVMLREQSRPQHLRDWFESAMVILSGMLVLGLSLGLNIAVLACVMANFFVLGFALLFIWRGTESVHWRLTTLGCLLLAALVFARFNDLFESLLARAVVFLLLGAVMFVVGLRYSRQSERQKIMRSRHA